LNNRIAILINARLEELNKVESIIDQLYADGKLPEEAYGNILVVVSEATLNAIHHGSGSDAEKEVEVIFDFEGTKMTIEVSDSGKGFDHQNLPDPTDPADIEKGSGRGIFIMKNLSDEIEFLNEGSTVCLSFDLGTAVSVQA